MAILPNQYEDMGRPVGLPEDHAGRVQTGRLTPEELAAYERGLADARAEFDRRLRVLRASSGPRVQEGLDWIRRHLGLGSE